MSPISKSTAALATFAATTVAGTAALLEGKFAVGSDITQMLRDRAWMKRLTKRIQVLGDEATVYHMLKLCDPAAPALWFEGRTYTYQEVRTETTRLASVLHSMGIRAGDFVAVFMTNSPEMIFTIYAVTKLGAVPALINAALRSETLIHCIKIAKAKLAIMTLDLADAMAAVSGALGPNFQCVSLDLLSFRHGAMKGGSQQGPSCITRQDLLQHVGDLDAPKRKLNDIGALIYTSGTTGKPKAVSIKNFLLVITSTPLALDVENPKRYFPLRTYSCLPLFHGTCLLAGFSYSVGCEGTFCIARKFSASKFAQELTASRATRMLYVGELCRYMLAAAPSEFDRAHSCIVAYGNGLQKDVWDKFRQRFNIGEIREIYRSTEGVAKFDNFIGGEGSQGKVGFSGALKRYVEDDTFLVKYDAEKEDLHRDPQTGFCVRAAPGEPGEAIGRVRTMVFYNEYLDDKEATQRKLVRNVFASGDLFQRSGDLLVQDPDGWVRFHDRTGDTFRWKGENVSAGEVRAFIAEMPQIQDAVVYSYKLEGYDGQAGAAAIVVEDGSKETEEKTAKELTSFLKSRGLPQYGIPRLVRFTEAISTGATFKHAKEVYKNRSWDPEENKGKDRTYWLDGDQYRPLDAMCWGAIKAGKAKL